MLHLNQPKTEPGALIGKTVADSDADLEKAYRALEQARRDDVPAAEMAIYHDRVQVCRDAISRVSIPEIDPPLIEIIDE